MAGREVEIRFRGHRRRGAGFVRLLDVRLVPRGLRAVRWPRLPQRLAARAPLQRLLPDAGPDAAHGPSRRSLPGVLVRDLRHRHALAQPPSTRRPDRHGVAAHRPGRCTSASDVVRPSTSTTPSASTCAEARGRFKETYEILDLALRPASRSPTRASTWTFPSRSACDPSHGASRSASTAPSAVPTARRSWASSACCRSAPRSATSTSRPPSLRNWEAASGRRVVDVSCPIMVDCIVAESDEEAVDRGVRVQAPLHAGPDRPLHPGRHRLGEHARLRGVEADLRRHAGAHQARGHRALDEVAAHRIARRRSPPSCRASSTSASTTSSCSSRPRGSRSRYGAAGLHCSPGRWHHRSRRRSRLIGCPRQLRRDIRARQALDRSGSQERQGIGDESMAETADAFLARQRPLVDQTRRTLEESRHRGRDRRRQRPERDLPRQAATCPAFRRAPAQPGARLGLLLGDGHRRARHAPRAGVPGLVAVVGHGLLRRAPAPRSRHLAHRTVARPDRRRALRALLPRRFAGRDRTAAAAPPPRRSGRRPRPDPEVRRRARVLPLQGERGEPRGERLPVGGAAADEPAPRCLRHHPRQPRRARAAPAHEPHGRLRDPARVLEPRGRGRPAGGEPALLRPPRGGRPGLPLQARREGDRGLT